MRRDVALAGIVLLVGALHVAAAWRHAGEPGLPLDDAWIHARLARGLSRGNGFSFNPGEPSAASSAPLWTLLLSMPALVGLPFPWAAYAGGLAASIALALAGARLVERVTGPGA